MRIVALVLVPVLFAGCEGSGPRREVGRVAHTLPAPAAMQVLRVDLGAGRVQVRVSADNQVLVEAVVWHADRPGATIALGAFADHVAVRERDGGLHLEDVHQKAADAADWELHVTVQVPGTHDVQVQVASGGVDIELPAANDVRVALGAGKLAAAFGAVAGVCSVRQSTGEVVWTVREQGPAGGLDIECSAGSVGVALPASLRGEFDVQVAAGGIRVDSRYGLAVERHTASASVRGVIGQAGPTHRVSVGTGEVHLR